MVVLRFVLLVFVWMAFLVSSAKGMFMYQDTVLVPIGRLFTNLHQRLAQNTNDYQATYQLARLHAMAYSTNLAVVKVKKQDETAPVFDYPGSDSGVPKIVTTPSSLALRQVGQQHLTNAFLLYERAIVLLKQSTNAVDQRWMILPTELGLAWCLDQAGRRTEAVKAYQKALSIAWKLEVSGDFEIKAWVQGVWSDVRSGQNPVHAQHRGFIGPGVCYSQEIIGYLLKLLDPVKDATKIAQLKQDQQTLLSISRAVTPILIPLESGLDLAELVDTNAQVAFDLDGSGSARKWAWITSKAAWLVYDPKGKGEVNSGLQMFGCVTFWIFWRDGYEALSALDDNGDGMLSGPELSGLALWTDVNANGLSEPGEVLPLAAFGITSLSCRRQTHPSGIAWSPAGVVFENGSSRPTYDWVAPCHEGD